MIEQFFRPESVAQALELKRQHLDQAVYLGGGSKLNAAPTRTRKTVAIDLSALGLDNIQEQDGQLHIGAMTPLQKVWESAQTPTALREAIGFIYSRHIRNQATLGGEIAAQQRESLLLPVLLVLQAKVILGNGKPVEIEDYINGARNELILSVMLPEPRLRCASRKVALSAGGLAVVTAAVALDNQGEMRIALDGVAEKPLRLRDVERRKLQDSALEQAVEQAIFPTEDLSGSVAYKRYISGVVVADLLTECQQQQEGV
ncbi:MAG: molybdopterin-dependent oxidoreductase FAD-binding subunit [Enterobacteriaceae bacterium]